MKATATLRVKHSGSLKLMATNSDSPMAMLTVILTVMPKAMRSHLR